MEAFLSNQAAVWITFGFGLLAVEAIAFGFASGVLLFGSLGAIVTGIILWSGLLPNQFIPAVACFAIATTAITSVLWMPLKRMQSGSELGHDRSSDLIGHRFTTAAEITIGSPGKEKYSGISWRVEPNERCLGKTIEAGTPVIVTSVSVGVFFVEPDAA